FSKVAFFLTSQKLRELWVIPIFFIIVTAVSAIIAFVLGWVLRLKRSQRSFAMAAAMFMNSNSLPIALLQSLVVSVPGLKWDEGDSKNAMLGRALTYLVMYSTLGMVLRWSYGVRLLSQADPEEQEAEVDERTPLLGGFDRDEYYSHPSLSSASESSVDGDHDARVSQTVVSQPSSHGMRPPPVRRRTTFYNSFPNSPNRSRANLNRYDTIPSSDHSIEDAALPSIVQRSNSGTVERIKRSILRAWTSFNDFMTVPLWASIASLVVAGIPSLQHWLQFHAQPIKGAISSAGNCSIPVTLVVLGAYFYPDPPEVGNSTPNVPGVLTTSQSTSTLVGTVRSFFAKPTHVGTPSLKQIDPRKGETKTVIIAVISRMILTPLVLMPLLVLSAKYDFHAVFEDPVFVVANVLLLASPPALTLAQITQAASGDAFERLISRTIFWSYCVVTPPTTIMFVLIGLMLTKI
ncbi:hypothetical protein P691DRAFT_804774, partial [Macrolepiota fuliginosa MF-IS2]